ncbi:MAG: hypothetical protein OXQ29_21850 [Rhodospirillaceae bacterium]|nr:hypothetical protein [Rhodospirillaceae bacterium]
MKSIQSEREAFLRLKAELARAYAAPDDAYHALSASDVIEKNREQPDSCATFARKAREAHAGSPFSQGEILVQGRPAE